MGFWNHWAGWGEESAWGTLVARAQFARIFKGTMIKPNIPQDPVTRLGNRAPDELFRKPMFAEAKLIVPMVYDGMGLLLKHGMGYEATTGAGPFDHVHEFVNDPYTRSADPLVGLSLEANLDLPTNPALLMAGGRVTEWGFDFKTGEELKLDMDLVGKLVTVGPKSVAPTFPDYEDAAAPMAVIPAQVTMKIDTVATEVVGCTLRVNNNLRTDRNFLGSAYIGGPLPAPGKANISGQIDKEWLNQDLYDDWVAGNEAALQITCTGPGNHVLVIDVPRVRYNGDTPEADEGGAQAQVVPFIALHDAGAGSVVGGTPLIITETNDSA